MRKKNRFSEYTYICSYSGETNKDNERDVFQDAPVRGCLPAMGYSFAAGTTDGPGAFNFSQGTTTGNPLWNSVRNLLAEPTPEDIECQKPKPILLATGRVTYLFY